MYEIAIHVDAERELNAAALYYEESVEGLGQQFLDEFEEAISQIQKFPKASPIYEEEYRRYLLERFPFGVIYRIDGDDLFIIAIAHLKRKPNYWVSR